MKNYPQRKYYALYIIRSALDTYCIGYIIYIYIYSSTQYNVRKPYMHYRVQNRVYRLENVPDPDSWKFIFLAKPDDIPEF